MKKQIQILLLASFLTGGIAACSGNKANNQSDSTNTATGMGSTATDSANGNGPGTDTGRTSTDTTGMRDSTHKP